MKNADRRHDDEVTELGGPEPAVYDLRQLADHPDEAAKCLPYRPTRELRLLFEDTKPSVDFEYPNPRSLLASGADPAMGGGEKIISAAPEGDGRHDDDFFSVVRVFIGGGIPVATTVAGLMLVIASAAPDPIVPNPYVAMIVLLAGLGLIVTASAALRERQRDC